MVSVGILVQAEKRARVSFASVQHLPRLTAMALAPTHKLTNRIVECVEKLVLIHKLVSLELVLVRQVKLFRMASAVPQDKQIAMELVLIRHLIKITAIAVETSVLVRHQDAVQANVMIWIQMPITAGTVRRFAVHQLQPVQVVLASNELNAFLHSRFQTLPDAYFASSSFLLS